MQSLRASRSLGLSSLAIVAIGVGPAAAAFREKRWIPVPGDFGDLIVVVVVALAAATFAGFAIRRGVRVLGALALLANVGVALLYGFLGLFFALGGSR